MNQVVVQPGLNLCCHLPLSPGLFGSILSRGIYRATDTFKLPSPSRHCELQRHTTEHPDEESRERSVLPGEEKGEGAPVSHHLVAYLRRSLLLAPGLRGTMWEKGTHLTDFSPWTTSMHRCAWGLKSWGLKQHILLWNNPGSSPGRTTPPPEGLNSTLW